MKWDLQTGILDGCYESWSDARTVMLDHLDALLSNSRCETCNSQYEQAIRQIRDVPPDTRIDICAAGEALILEPEDA